MIGPSSTIRRDHAARRAGRRRRSWSSSGRAERRPAAAAPRAPARAVRAMLVEAQVSSMKTSRPGSRSSCPSTPGLAPLQDVRAILLAGVRRLFLRVIRLTLEEAPQRAVADDDAARRPARGVSSSSVMSGVSSSTPQDQRRMRLDPARPAIPAERLRVARRPVPATAPASGSTLDALTPNRVAGCPARLRPCRNRGQNTYPEDRATALSTCLPASLLRQTV